MTVPALDASPRVSLLSDEPIRGELPVWAHIAIVTNIAATGLAAGYIFLGLPLLVPVAVAAPAALFTWLKLSDGRPASRRVLPAYVATIVGLHVHSLEQYAYDYPGRIGELFPGLMGDIGSLTVERWVLAQPVVVTAVLLIGSVLVFYHHRLGTFLAWFLGFVALSSAAWVLAVPVVARAGFTYVPGMATAVLPAALGVQLIRMVAGNLLGEEDP